MRFKHKRGHGKHTQKVLRDGKEVSITTRAGEILICEWDEISEGARNKFESLDGEPADGYGPPATQPLRMTRYEDGTYDVFNDATGNQINDERLSEEEAFGIMGVRIQHVVNETNAGRMTREEADRTIVVGAEPNTETSIPNALVDVVSVDLSSEEQAAVDEAVASAAADPMAALRADIENADKSRGE